jgi:hypothetical protein
MDAADELQRRIGRFAQFGENEYAPQRVTLFGCVV